MTTPSSQPPQPAQQPLETFDVVVVGGGPAGATAAHDLARQGRSVLLLDRAGRIKPCGGAIPPRLIKDFAIPDDMLVAKARSARMISPSDNRVDIPIDNGFVGMVDRDHFDEWLRERAAASGAVRRTGTFEKITREGDDGDGMSIVHFEQRESAGKGDGVATSVRARSIVGADGAKSKVASQQVKGAERTKYVFAYHEIVKAPAVKPDGYDGSRCDVYYRGLLSPDFYGWVFPHGDTLSIGTGSADKGFSLRTAVGKLRDTAGLAHTETLRREGAPIPMKPLPRWDNGRDVVLAGDAAGVVAPASGEGIYYAMYGGRLAAEAVQALLTTGDVRSLKLARKRFMKAHGTVFRVLSIMQWFWYSTEKRRESFVKICEDRDVQQLTFESYMNKELTRKKPMAHVRIFFKDMAHLLGFCARMTAWGLDLNAILVAAVATISVAVAGGLLTDLGPWYQKLVQPRWKPPDWAFGPIWTVVFSCAATAGVMAWARLPDAAAGIRLLALFALNGALNVLWSVLYFRFKRPDWSMVELVFLWLSILWLAVEMWPYSPRSSGLLAPYLIWVATAGCLNWATIRLNGPFGKR